MKIAGIKGDEGIKGEKGMKGDVGEDGVGLQGNKGEPGRDGSTHLILMSRVVFKNIYKNMHLFFHRSARYKR